MNIEHIEASIDKLVAWGYYLLSTFKKLGITRTEVTKNSNISGSSLSKIKEGKKINADAYVRLTEYAVHVIRERKANKQRLPVTEEELIEQWVKIFIG